MEEHDTTNSGSKKSEFLDLWMDQLEETTRQEKVEEFYRRFERFWRVDCALMEVENKFQGKIAF